MRSKALVLGLVLCGAVFAVAASAGKVESIGAMTDAGAFAPVLASEGTKATLVDGSVVSVWMRKSLEPNKKKDAQAVYPELARGSFVGVIKFERQAADFRGQTIKPGTYTMRYESLPADGNHMGVAAQPDFVLLVPMGADPGPEAVPSYEELVQLSAKASGTTHCAAFSMVPVEGVGSFPALFYTADGYTALAVQIGKLPVAIVVKGVAQQ